MCYYSSETVLIIKSNLSHFIICFYNFEVKNDFSVFASNNRMHFYFQIRAEAAGVVAESAKKLEEVIFILQSSFSAKYFSAIYHP